MRGGQQGLLGRGGGFGPTLLKAIQDASLTTGLSLCLDAGDVNSWPGSGSQLLDVSGGGYDFNLDGSLPQFHGSVGSKDAYFDFDGMAYFTYDSPNEAWMDALHKNNAAFTILGFWFEPNLSSVPTGQAGFVGTTGNANVTPVLTGIAYSHILSGATSDDQGSIYAARGANPPALSAQGGGITGGGQAGWRKWHMRAVRIDEAAGAGGGFHYVDGGYEQVSGVNTFDATYSSPSTSAATYRMQIGALGNGEDAVPMSTDSHADFPRYRLSCLAIWSAALSKANLDTLWTALRPRFGL